MREYENIRGRWALQKFLRQKWNHCLDIGSGHGVHAEVMRKEGRKVTTLDFKNADITGNYLEIDVLPHDAIWCSHTLEHQPNPNLFLKKVHGDLLEDGVLGITVPPPKPNLVGGHVTLWTSGLLIYHLILAGFDCNKAMIGTYGYNISVILKKKTIQLPELVFDYGDIQTLSEFFPCQVEQGTNGFLPNINW